MICAKTRFSGYAEDGRRLYHFGGGGSSSSSSNSTSYSATDRRIVTDGGGIGINSGNGNITVNSIDREVVGKALDTIAAADVTNGEGFTQLLGLADKLFAGGSALLQGAGNTAMQAVEAIQTAQNDAKGSVDQKTIIILAAAGVAAAYAMKKG